MNSKGRASSVARGMKLIALLALVAMILVGASGCPTPQPESGAARGESPERGRERDERNDLTAQQVGASGDGSGPDFVLSLLGESGPAVPGLPYQLRDDYFKKEVAIYVRTSDQTITQATYVRYRIKSIVGPEYSIKLSASTGEGDRGFKPEFEEQSVEFSGCDYTNASPPENDCTNSGFPSVLFGKFVPQQGGGNVLAKLDGGSGAEVKIDDFCLQPKNANPGCVNFLTALN